MADLAVDLAPNNPRELRLANPLIAASGCFGYGQEYQGTIDIEQLGAFVSKGITPEPRSGNPMPRITETPGGMLNAIGLQNPGIRAFLRRYPPIWERWPVPAIVNISAESVADFAELARRCDDVPGIAALEVNISCPNISAGGFCFGWNAEMSRDVTAAVRSATSLPIIVKLSPGALDIAEIALAVEDGGADAISLINTLVGMSIDVRRRAPVLANRTGGLSGPAIKPVAVRMTWQVAQVVGIPVIGLGGIMTRDDALEFLMAGASAFQVGTGFFAQPGQSVGIVGELDAWLDAQGCGALSDIVGTALPNGLPPRRTRSAGMDASLIEQLTRATTEVSGDER